MASKFAKSLQIPSEFPETLREFAREVLRQQGKIETREDIIQFGVAHFQSRIERREKDTEEPVQEDESVAGYVRYSEERIYEILREIIQNAIHQNNNNARVPYAVLNNVMCQIAEVLHLSPIELNALYAQVAEDEDGTVDLSELLPLTFKAVKSLRSGKQERESRAHSFQKKYQPQDIMLHGMFQDEMESILREILHHNDLIHSGVTRNHLKACLRDEDLGFSTAEVNILMAEAPNEVSEGFSDFVSICFPKLRDVFWHGIIEFPSEREAVSDSFYNAFINVDEDGSGFLPTTELVKATRDADVGLTKVQIVALMAETEENQQGLVNFEKFATRVALMAVFFVSFEYQQQMAEFSRRFRATSAYYQVFDLNQPAFEHTLSAALEKVDADRQGFLDRDEIVEAIQSSFSAITIRQMRCLLAFATKALNNLDFGYHPIIQYGFQALQRMQEYDSMIAEM